MQVHTLSVPTTLTADAVSDAQSILQTAITALPAGARVQLQVGGVQTFDSAGLALLLACRRLAAQQSKQLSVTGWPADMQSLAQIYGVWELLDHSAAASDAVLS